MNEARGYTSPLRKQQAEDTRRRIVDSALELIQETPQEALSHERIAKRSEIALRTVYRHFPSRTELLDAVWQESDRRLQLAHYPDTESDMLASLDSVYGNMDAHPGLIRGLLYSNAGQEMRRRDSERRRQGVVKALADATSQLSEGERRQVIAVFQSLYSARTWEMMRDRAHLKDGEVSKAVGWAMRTLLDSLRRDQKQNKTSVAKMIKASSKANKGGLNTKR
ncbi:TetR/AcrR family transcriptional regulator [Terriglobus sp. TAA 43]|uniref:TetR/AcrR family transcriptional regulator n=1 Tax=Terriglobus sp. TAA 43 TaxID=278961 RepID=UPI0006904880|nr:TetR/AcrR family transcriptional regulator [Terriglobus sp. TAA 43]